MPDGLSLRRDDPRDRRSRAAGDLSALFPHSRLVRRCADLRQWIARQASTPDAKGFVRIERQWSKGDIVKLVFPMSVQLCAGYETEYPSMYRKYFNFKPDEVFKKRRFLMKAFPTDRCCLRCRLPTRIPIPAWPMRGGSMHWTWTFIAVAGEAEVERGPMPPKWDWPLDAPLAIKLPAKTFDWKPSDIQPLPAEPVEGTVAETHSFGALRLHQVPDIHVPRDEESMGEAIRQ